MLNIMEQERMAKSEVRKVIKECEKKKNNGWKNGSF
jgi:hypothetical protein